MTSQQVLMAKEILKNYRALTRLTGKFLPMAELNRAVTCNASKVVHKEPLRTPEQFESERQAIIQAWQLLDSKERTVLYYSYLCKEPMTMQQIASAMSYSMKSIEKWKNQGSKSFLKKYKKEILH